MFLNAARFFGSFPFTKNGEFNFLLYMFYITQLAFALWYLLIKSMVSRIDDWRYLRIDKLSICVHVVGLWAYFLPLILQPLMVLRRRSEFESVATFFAGCSYPWLIRYVSHQGVALVMIISYIALFGTLVVQKLAEGSLTVLGALMNNRMHYIYGLDFLVTMQHTSLVHRVSMEFVLARERMKYDVFGAVDYAQHLFRVSKTANAVYGPQLVVRVTQTLITLLSFAYGTITDTSPHGNSSILEKIGGVMIITAILVELWCLCGTCDNARSNAEAFNREVFKIMRNSRDLCKNKKLGMYVTMEQKVDYTACGLFGIGYPLVNSILAAATTYLVILVQFDMSEG